MFSEVTFETPLVQDARADLVLVSRSGHLIIVEVKLAQNPDLRDRQVISQVLDYAIAVQESPAEALGRLIEGGTVVQLIQRHFPDVTEPDELAERLVQRCARGEILMVIAADRVPPGLRGLVEKLAEKFGNRFDLRVVEIKVFTKSGQPNELLLVPQTKARTEVVATTRVEVTLREGEKPLVKVAPTAPEEVAERVASAGRRKWDEASFFADIADRKIAPDGVAAI